MDCDATVTMHKGDNEGFKRQKTRTEAKHGKPPVEGGRTVGQGVGRLSLSLYTHTHRRAWHCRELSLFKRKRGMEKGGDGCLPSRMALPSPRLIPSSSLVGKHCPPRMCEHRHRRMLAQFLRFLQAIWMPMSTVTWNLFAPPRRTPPHPTPALLAWE